MEHLNIDEIIQYVTATKVDRETLELMTKVNGHIRSCSVCKEKVNAYEMVNDEIKKDIDENCLDLNRIDDLIKIKKEIDNEC